MPAIPEHPRDTKPTAHVPPLPWSPALEPSQIPDRIWLVSLAGIALHVTDLLQREDLRSWDWAAAPGALIVLWTTLAPSCAAWTLSTDGLTVTGPLLRRFSPWKALTGVDARKRKVEVVLGGRSVLARFDGRGGRPSAVEVAGVVERLRLLSTSASTRGRLSLSWGAAVFLPAVVVVVAATGWVLVKG